MSKIIEVKNLSKSYGDIKAVQDISFDVEEGKLFAFLGENGAGKSTTINMLCTSLAKDSGSIVINGHDIDKDIEGVKRSIGIVYQNTVLDKLLTVEENLKIGAYLRKDKEGIAKDMQDVFEKFPRLLERKNQIAGTLSGGEQQMLAMGRALMSRPKLLLLDEPSMGLAPLLVKEIFNIIKEINAGGTTILLVEQNANMALSIADKAYVLETGRITLSGTAQELASSEEVRKAYLGG